MKYQLQMAGFVSALQWEFSFERESDADAASYMAERLANDIASRAGAQRVDLFNLETKKRVCSFVFDKPIVRQVS